MESLQILGNKENEYEKTLEVFLKKGKVQYEDELDQRDTFGLRRNITSSN